MTTEAMSIDEMEARIRGEVPIGRRQLMTQLDADLSIMEPSDKNAHLWARHPDDYYTEPEWCSQRLFETVNFEGTIVDPACGSGRIVRAGRQHRQRAEALGDKRITKVLGYDIVQRCKECHEEVEDFLTSDYETDNIVSNPPFGLCNLANKKSKNTRNFEFVERALATATNKVALLLPLTWLAGDKKARFLQTTPLAQVLILTPRPSMPPGPVIEAGIDPGGGEDDFCWVIWDHKHKGPPTLGWLNRDA